MNNKEENWAQYLTKEKMYFDEGVGTKDIENRIENTVRHRVAARMFLAGETDEKIILYTDIKMDVLTRLKRQIKQSPDEWKNR